MENIGNDKVDEIDLIDLFIVLLKYRKLILGTTLAVLLILGAGYFIYPSYQLKKTVGSQLYEANISIELNSIAEIIIAGYNPQKYFFDASSLLYSLQKAGYKELGYGKNAMVDISQDADKQKALNIVRQRLVKNQTLDGNPLNEEFRLLKIGTTTTTTTNLTFRDKNSEKALMFLTALVEKINEKLLLDLTPQFNQIVSSYERILSIEAPNDVIKEAVVRDSKEYQAAVTILQGKIDLLKLGEEPYVFQAQFTIEKFQNSYKKKAVIVLLAVFFLSIFLAFILQFLAQIKSNDESMAKIREAMKK